ncbi:hypothetical protein V3C33_08160 [Micrococcaceae bacterium Sec5.7]
MTLKIVGAVCGLAWASSLRGYMAEVAGAGLTVDRLGTFGLILLPGAVAGALLGWSEYLRRSGGARGWRWLALAPLAFLAVFASPDAIVALVTTGNGGGAVEVVLVGILGGYALSSREPTWARVVWHRRTRHRSWAVQFFSLLAVLALASAIPHRKVIAA